jgi:tRNA-modifying protein YgfZ
VNAIPASSQPAPLVPGAAPPNPRAAPADELDALEQGRAFVSLSGWGMVRVTGADARAWLDDLLTADVASLRPGAVRRALFLAPTGRIRADVHVQCSTDGFLLLQDPLQPDAIGELLDRYVLSSRVAIDDVAGTTTGFALPGPVPASLPAAEVFEPSVLGEGHDLVARRAGERVLRDALLAAGLTEAGADAVEVRRIRRGRPRMGVDYGTDRHPAEVGLDDAIDAGKGCFPGQEAVAKLRNLGHPPWVFLPVRANELPVPGEEVVTGNGSAGVVTSVAPAAGGGWSALVRVRWAARDGRLRTASGGALEAARPVS